MESLFLVLAVFSIAAACGFAAVAWRLLRDDRRRSAARVAALSSVLDGPGRHAPIDAGTDSSGGADLDLSPATENVSTGRVGVASMFEMTPGGLVKGRPMLKAAVVAVMGIIVVVAAAMGNDNHAGTPRAAAAQAAGAPLELMSMRYAREGSTLTVTGLVRNPKSGREARRVTAVVFAFDRTGAFVASGRAPLDFVVLDPDDESPFVVAVANVKDVARYRVSFRTDDGVIRHIDRRAGQTQLAGNR